MRFSLKRAALLAAALVALLTAKLEAVTITLDYRYDQGVGFFAPNSPARAALEAATSFYSSILNDTLAAMDRPTFTGSGGTVSWDWTLDLNSPTTLIRETLSNINIGADEYLIFPGVKPQGSSTLAVGTFAGVASAFRDRSNLSTFHPDEVDVIRSIDASFIDAVIRRGEPTGFAAPGGSISFNSTINWHFDHRTHPPSGKNDFFSVALHELGHTLGFGVSTQWTSLVSNSKFVGQAAVAEYGGQVPLAPGNTHWTEGLGSTVFGGTATQAAAMTPGLTTGTRKRVTAIDAAGLTDIGWSVILPPGVAGDYNGDGSVNAADYTVWRNSRGQTGSNLAADGDRDNVIDRDDYRVWKAHYGQASASATTLGAAVPEPATVALLAMALRFFVRCRRLSDSSVAI
jgi:hypothetical protein